MIKTKYKSNIPWRLEKACLKIRYIILIGFLMKRNFYFTPVSDVYLISPVTHELKESIYSFVLFGDNSYITQDFVYAHLLLLHSKLHKFRKPNYNIIKIMQNENYIADYKINNFTFIQKHETQLHDYTLNGNYDFVKNLLNSRDELEKALEIFLSHSVDFQVKEDDIVCNMWKSNLCLLLN